MQCLAEIESPGVTNVAFSGRRKIGVMKENASMTLKTALMQIWNFGYSSVAKVAQAQGYCSPSSIGASPWF